MPLTVCLCKPYNSIEQSVRFAGLPRLRVNLCRRDPHPMALHLLSVNLGVEEICHIRRHLRCTYPGSRRIPGAVFSSTKFGDQHDGSSLKWCFKTRPTGQIDPSDIASATIDSVSLCRLQRDTEI
jgi:hypothetical protein